MRQRRTTERNYGYAIREKILNWHNKQQIRRKHECDKCKVSNFKTRRFSFVAKSRVIFIEKLLQLNSVRNTVPE